MLFTRLTFSCSVILIDSFNLFRTRKGTIGLNYWKFDPELNLELAVVSSPPFTPTNSAFPGYLLACAMGWSQFFSHWNLCLMRDQLDGYAVFLGRLAWSLVSWDDLVATLGVKFSGFEDDSFSQLFWKLQPFCIMLQLVFPIDWLIVWRVCALSCENWHNLNMSHHLLLLNNIIFFMFAVLYSSWRVLYKRFVVL